LLRFAGELAVVCTGFENARFVSKLGAFTQVPQVPGEADVHAQLPQLLTIRHRR
jgi:hypothetical protein